MYNIDIRYKRMSLSSVFSNFLPVLLFLSLLNSPETSFSQSDSFVYLKDGKFMLDSSEYFPLAISYSLDIVKDINGNFFISPCGGYCKWGQCGKKNSRFYCGTNILEWKSKIKKHIDKISEMGFNVIRVLGFGVSYNPDKKNTNTLFSNYYHSQEDPDKLYCFKRYKGYKINRKTTDKHIDLVEEFVEIIREHNNEFPDNQLKIMMTTGTGGLQYFSWKYTKFLTTLGERLKNYPEIFAFEINFEPYYLGYPKYEINKKYERAENFAQWYNALKEAAPSQLITFGALLHDVMNWDAQTFPVDFINLHLYPVLKNPYDSREFERYKCILKWFSEAYDKPWIIGETGLGGNTVASRQNSNIPTEEQQKEFAYSSLAYSRWYGGIGYAWWQYKEVPWVGVKAPKARSNYLGLVRMKDEKERHKAAAAAFLEFDPFAKCYTCFDPDTEIYYNPKGYQFLNIKGRITMPDGQPVRNVYIRCKSKNESYYTFSDENGEFKIYTISHDHIYSLSATYPGMTVIQLGQWGGPKLDPELNLQIEFLDKSLLPYQQEN
jgi:hypothetical protein